MAFCCVALRRPRGLNLRGFLATIARECGIEEVPSVRPTAIRLAGAEHTDPVIGKDRDRSFMRAALVVSGVCRSAVSRVTTPEVSCTSETLHVTSIVPVFVWQFSAATGCLGDGGC